MMVSLLSVLEVLGLIASLVGFFFQYKNPGGKEISKSTDLDFVKQGYGFQEKALIAWLVAGLLWAAAGLSDRPFLK